MGTHLAGARRAAARAFVTGGAFEAVPATREHGPWLARLFERSEVRCYCRYWHFAGSTNEWLDRSANHPEQSRGEMFAALEASSPEMSGVVAVTENAAIGWMKVAPAASVPKLYAQRLYRGLPCFGGDREGVFAIGCILVDPEWRRARVAATMLDRAVELVRERGGRAIEAFPRRAEGISDAEAWTGPYSLYRRAGFDTVHDFAPYPVVRRVLA